MPSCHGVVQQGGGVRHIGGQGLFILHQLLVDLLPLQGLLVVELRIEHVLQAQHMVDALHQGILVIEQVADLEADFGVFVGVEGGDA